MIVEFIIEPLFFETITSKGQVHTTVTSSSYSAILRNHVINTTVFMQEGAPPHIAIPAKQLLRETYGEDRFISRNFKHSWPSRYPDLNRYDFWLWGYLKDCVYKEKYSSVVDPKTSVIRHIPNTEPETLNDAVDHAVLHLQNLIAHLLARIFVFYNTKISL